MLAARYIGQGELIIREKAVIGLNEDVDMWSAGKEIARQVKTLSKLQKEQFYKLTRKEEMLEVAENFIVAAGDNPERVKAAEAVSENIQEAAIFFNNDISTEDKAKCLFLQLALTNHSCAPNSSWTAATAAPRQLELRAAQNIEKGQEINVNYIIEEGRYASREKRQDRLKEGWGFDCRCSTCCPTDNEHKDEDIRQKIRLLRSNMSEECNQAVEGVRWPKLLELQQQVVDMVEKLPEGVLLLTREYQSMAHMEQLARAQGGNDRWKQLLEKLKVERCWKEFEKCEAKLENWKEEKKKGGNPTIEEIQDFLWLM